MFTHSRAATTDWAIAWALVTDSVVATRRPASGVTTVIEATAAGRSSPEPIGR